VRVLVLLTIALAALGAVGPAAPAGTLEGDIVEIGGELYQMHGGVLYTLDDPALADPNLTMTVTGSRVDGSDAKKRVVRTETITSADIAETGARTLGDVLEEQAGIQVNSALGLGQEVVIDGLDGKHVLILIDGRPVNGRVNNRVDVGRIPVSASSVARIEVVRGPMSALYGSEALGGVVNIVTKRPTLDPYGEIELGTQALDNADAGVVLWSNVGLHARGGLGPVATGVDVNMSDLPSIDRNADGKSDVPDRRQLGLHADVAMPFSGSLSDVSFRASVDGASSHSVARVAGDAPFSDRARNDEWSVAALVEADVLRGDGAHAWSDGGALALDLRLNRYGHVFDKLPRGDDDAPPRFCANGGLPWDTECPAPPDLRTDTTLSESRLELRYVDTLVDEADAVPFASEVTTSAGATLSRQFIARENGDGDDTIPGGGGRDTFSLFAEVLWRPFPWLAIVPGGRADSTFPAPEDVDGTALAPKLAARVDGPFGLGVRASYGRGFRLPSFEERFLRFDHSELGYIVEGTADLRPERSHGMRAELVWSPLDEVDLGVEGSLNLVDDLIVEDQNGSDPEGIPVFAYENVGRAYTSTIHTRASLGPFVGFRVNASYQYLINAVDASACPPSNPYFCAPDEGARSLPLRAAHSLDVTARYVVPWTSTTVFGRVDALSERPLNVEGDVAPGWVTLSTGVRQPLFDSIEAVVALENILDAYDPIFGPKPGRTLMLSVRVWE
jgi:outer membrane receptor for ferrienterochelin and colicins